MIVLLTILLKKSGSKIEEPLKNDEKVCVPLIMEQNRFDFEPSLKDIKSSKKSGNKKEAKKDTREEERKSKSNRIKKSSMEICPYSGEVIGGDDGEFDHIIPQASSYGTLNDEANLIYVSKIGNARKGKTRYQLSDLNKKYLIKIFNHDDPQEIKKIIYKELLGDSEVREKNLDNKSFIFGKYQNFPNLNDDQKKAFRHALFLVGDTLREIVIGAILNRNRTIVNGTQRYFAQCIADKLYKKAHEINKQKQINFDYFEYGTDPISDKSTYALRMFYLDNIDQNNPESEKHVLKKYMKQEGVKQEDYSHLIDAQMAFILACQEHRDNGSMGIEFDFDEETIWQGISNTETAEISPLKFFESTKVLENDCKSITLNRGKPEDGNRPHRSYTGATFYADHYVPLLLKKENGKICMRFGFSWDQGVEYKDKKGVVLRALSFSKKLNNIKSLEELYVSLEKKYETTNGFYYIDWDKRKIHEYFVRNFSNSHLFQRTTNKWLDDVGKLFMNIHYRTQRLSVAEVLEKKQEKKKEKTDEEKTCKTEITILKKSMPLPVEKDWNEIKEKWNKEKSNDPNKNVYQFLEDYPLFKQVNYGQLKSHHQKARKIFSLPSVAGKGAILHERISWNKNNIYQIWDDSDSRKDENKFSSLVIINGELKGLVTPSFRSKKQFKLSVKEKDFPLSTGNHNLEKIPPSKWYPYDLNSCKDGKKLTKYLKKLEYQFPNVSVPKIKLTPFGKIDEQEITEITDNALLPKPKDNKEAKKQNELKNGVQIEYRGRYSKEFEKIVVGKIIAGNIFK